MLEQEIMAVQWLFNERKIEDTATFSWNRIKKFLESCQLSTTKVKTPAEEPTPEGEIERDPCIGCGNAHSCNGETHCAEKDSWDAQLLLT